GHEELRRLRVLVMRPSEVAEVLALAPQAEVVVGDLGDPATLESLFEGCPETPVVHAAGVIHPTRFAEFEEVNVEGTRALVAAARAAGAPRLVHISSNSAFGVNPHSEDVFAHREPFRPYLGYGQSKMRAELLVREAHRPGVFDTVVVRPPWFYGPFQPERQSRFFTMIAAGRFPLLGDGSQRRSMVYLDNLVQGVMLGLTHPAAPGEAFWVADRRPYPMAEIVETVREILQQEGYAVRSGPLRLPRVVGAWAERADRLLQARERYVAEVHVVGELDKTIACDISVTERLLGYRPEVELAEGMRRSVRWCRERGIDLAPRAVGGKR
ncbi:MAG: NAD(P)-dependent oxidoreductase, partial [Nocardioides sp.]